MMSNLISRAFISLSDSTKNMLENVSKWLMVIIAQDSKDTVNPICPELWSGVLQKATYIFELYLLIRAAAALLIEFF